MGLKGRGEMRFWRSRTIASWALGLAFLAGCSSATGTNNVATATSSPVGGQAPSQHTFYLRPVLCQIPVFDASAPPQTAPAGNFDGLCADGGASGLPSTNVASELANQDVILPSYAGSSPRYVLGPADLTGADVSMAKVIVDAAGQYHVQLQFTSEGSTVFDKVAAQRYPFYAQNRSNPPYQSMEAVELDGRVLSAPTIQAASFNGTAVISGPPDSPFTKSQAQTVAKDIELSR